MPEKKIALIASATAKNRAAARKAFIGSSGRQAFAPSLGKPDDTPPGS
jgi:hypothetical protein